MPHLHMRHSPQLMVNGTTTRSPTFSLVIVVADLDHLAHGLVAHHVAGLHVRHEAAHQMQVRAADGAARDLDDGVAAILDLRVGDGFAANIFLAVPAQCAHFRLRGMG